MKIIQIDPTQSQVVAQIARVYQEAFGGAPWYETWEITTIINDFTNEMCKAGAICVGGQIEGEVVGFAWGYTISSDDSNLDEHLDAPGVHSALSGEYFYLDECAVTPLHHGQGIGKQLVRAIFAEQTYKEVLLRTKDGSPMYNLITHMEGAVIQYISEGRVIMRMTLS